MIDKHTDGPWKIIIIEGHAPYTIVVNDDDEVICDNVTYYPTAVSEPNMILISAAPDMLEALEQSQTDLICVLASIRTEMKRDANPDGLWAGVPEVLEGRISQNYIIINKAKGLDG